MEISDSIRSAQSEVHIVVVVGKPVRRAAEDKAVVRVVRENHGAASFRIDRIDRDVAVGVGAEVDLEDFTDVVDFVLVAVCPEIHAQSVLPAHNRTDCVEGAAERRRFQQRHQGQTDSENKDEAFHGLPP
jgi:hypothetical protein